MSEPRNIDNTHEITGQVDYAIKKKYRWISESGKNTCEKCKSLDGKVFDINDLPKRPHPNCKCRVEEISIVEGSVAKLYGYRDEKFNLEIDAKEILGDLSVIRKKINDSLEYVIYSDTIEKKELLRHNISLLENKINKYIERIPELNRNSNENLFLEKSMELASFRSRVTEINNKLEKIKTNYGILNKDGLMTGGAASITQDIEDSPTIAGVKRGKPMDTIEANEGKVNPNHYHYNCQSCVAVYEARLRGYDITVMPKNEKTAELITQLASHPNWIYINPETGEHPVMERSRVSNAEDCRKWLEEKVKKGERYAFAYSSKGSRDNGHIIFLFRNYKNKLTFYDPQDGGIYNDLCLNEMEYHVDMGDYKIDYSPSVFRIDNTDLDIEIINKISKPCQ